MSMHFLRLLTAGSFTGTNSPDRFVGDNKIFGQTDVAFFGLLRAGSMIISILATHFVEKRIDTSSPLAIGRALLLVTGLITAGMVGFASCITEPDACLLERLSVERSPVRREQKWYCKL